MLSIQSPITDMPLSTKERNALQLLGVVTVKDFLQVNLQGVFRLRGFGAITYAKLNRSRNRLREMLFPNSFEGDEAAGSPHDYSDIATLRLTARGLTALRRLKVDTVRDFLLLDLNAIPPIKNSIPEVDDENTTS